MTIDCAEAVKIELAGQEHLARIPAVELAAARIFADEDLPDNVRFGATELQTLRRACNESRLWVAIDQREAVVGFALADVVDGRAHLDELSVVPEFGRRGIGTRLVQAVCKWAGHNGYDGLSLITFRHLPWNAPFYEKLGFKRLSRTELGAGLMGLIREEANAGIEIRNRVGMILRLKDQSPNQVAIK